MHKTKRHQFQMLETLFLLIRLVCKCLNVVMLMFQFLSMKLQNFVIYCIKIFMMGRLFLIYTSANFYQSRDINNNSMHFTVKKLFPINI